MDELTWLYAIFVFLFSLCIGSFLNVVIYRVPNSMSIIKPASHCPKCDYVLKWYDNIPLLSYIILKGRCRSCKEKISPRYFIVELMTGVIATLLFLYYGFTTPFFYSIPLLFILIIIAFIDYDTYLIYDRFNIMLFVLSILSFIFNPLKGNDVIKIDYIEKLLGLLIIVVFFLIIFIFSKLRKKELMGFGDIKYLFCISLLFGGKLILLIIFLAAILGVLIELPLNKILKKRHASKGEQGLPFGPFLAIATLIVYVFGIPFLTWYFGLFME